MELKYNKKNALLTEGIVILLLLYSFLGYLLPESLSYMFLIIAIVGLLFDIIIYKKEKVSKKQLLIVTLIGIFISIQMLQSPYSIFSQSSINISITRSMVLFIGILICLNGKWMNNGLKYIFMFSMIHVTATIIAFFAPNIYQSFILPILPPEIATEAINFLMANAYSGITEQTGRNAFYLSVAVAVTFSFILMNFNTGKKQRLIIFYGIIVLALLALLLTGKRGHLVANLFSILMIVIINAKLKGKSIILRLSVILIIMSILLYILTIVFPETAAPFIRFLDRQGGDQTSGRLDLYLYAIDMFKEKPILGWGTGAFTNTYGMGNHNIYLQLLSEHGLVGFLSFFSILIINLHFTLVSLKQSNIVENMLNKKFLFYSLYIQIFYLIYGLTGNPLSDGFILIIYLMAMSIPYTVKRNVY